MSYLRILGQIRGYCLFCTANLRKNLVILYKSTKKMSVRSINAMFRGFQNKRLIKQSSAEYFRYCTLLHEKSLPWFCGSGFSCRDIKSVGDLVGSGDGAGSGGGQMSAMPALAHSSIWSSGQIEACTSPMWAFLRRNMHSRLCPMPPPIDKGSSPRSSMEWNL